MSTKIFEAYKKSKRTPNFYGFHSFLDPGCPIKPTGPFRDNVRYFLQQCAELEEYTVEGMQIWSTFLVHKNRGVAIPLYTIEENVKNNDSRSFCDHCRCAGWSHHFVSKRKYHLIIPADCEWNQHLNDGVFDDQTHILHGLIHCNGFGHLICINGNEGGSKFLCGREVMDLWDRICTNLRARKITVEDLSKKHSMDLRLLYGVAYGHTWFGRWDYKFSHGSFGIMEHNYERAIEMLSSIELDQVIEDFRYSSRSNVMKQMVVCYRGLSDAPLITIRDLFRFMLAVKSCNSIKEKPNVAPVVRACSSSRYLIRNASPSKSEGKEKSARYRKFSNIAASLDSRWPVRRLEFTADVIVDALKEKKATNRFGSCGMSRQEARDAARLHIGDTGLIDYVLKSMNNVIVGGYVVRRAVNRATRVLEYTIQELRNCDQSEQEKLPEPVQNYAVNPGTDVYSDVLCLYNNLLLSFAESNVLKLAVRTVLDSKHFVKEWPFRDDPDDILLRFICCILPSSSGLEAVLRKGYPPGEMVEVPLHSTIGDLKTAIESAMRDTYCIMDNFMVTDIVGMETMEDCEVLFGIIESGSELWVRGFGLDLESELKNEGGADNWTVNCRCGARDDDGERMVSCDICEIWQHTRCCGIEDSEVVPPLFVCEACCTSLAPPRAQNSFEYGLYATSLVPCDSEFGMDLIY
ncbi:PHD finger protein MALE MEIOCYTE DEATH 1 [Nicotiana sylvestris]|uniref:PHD finger protein MALE MEIOCYTE DEATH 1-like n=2 Tax=Nicotiana TaxID=4085 RepID=A0A1S4CYA6_TOBAC|nr:PREDICTED: PHD finger protein MALE MEIOCYTE DEATH 1 [Nicotiana sylvestris]XP_016506122.1 PREDICTED: PHD finger protein MALE MEIOCYTE DEATH 1-like [Nicotiana tabacum]